jgi:hypothetical protein
MCYGWLSNFNLQTQLCNPATHYTCFLVCILLHRTHTQTILTCTSYLFPLSCYTCYALFHTRISFLHIATCYKILYAHLVSLSMSFVTFLFLSNMQNTYRTTRICDKIQFPFRGTLITRHFYDYTGAPNNCWCVLNNNLCSNLVSVVVVLFVSFPSKASARNTPRMICKTNHRRTWILPQYLFQTMLCE